MKINHILFPVDFSECSRTLNREVEWVANHFHADVTLMHVFEIPVNPSGTDDAPPISAEYFQQFAADAKRRLTEYPIQLPSNRVSRVITGGDAARCIKNWVEEHEVDLIMMGTHGYGSLRRVLLGSVAMKLLHDVSCPVWTHSIQESAPSGTPGVSRIICALELTQEAVPLLRFTKEAAEELGASVRIIHTVPETVSRPYRYFDMDLHKHLKECAAKDIAQSQCDAGTDFPVTITDGLIGRDTAALATAQGAELIVIGRGKPQDLFGTIRTHAYDIIRRAPCPVLSYSCFSAESPSFEKQKENDTVLSSR